MEDLLANLNINESNNKTISDKKNEIRSRIWTKLESERDTCLEKYPESCHHKIPYFKGCKKAAHYVTKLGKFTKAKVIKVNPSLAQMQLRKLILDAQKTLVVPSPALETYGSSDPDKVFCYKAKKSAKVPSHKIMTKKGIIAHGQPMLDDWSSCPKIDIVVVGSVAVTKSGRRLGKGLGYAELEWGILYDLGVVDQYTLVITTVHDYQIVSDEELSSDLQEIHDLPVDIIVTPTRTWHVRPKLTKPECGILWDDLKDHLKSLDIIEILRAKKNNDVMK